MLRKIAEGSEINVGWEIANSGKLPKVWGRNVFVVLDGSDTIFEWGIGSVVNVQEATSTLQYHFSNAIHNQKALGTDLQLISDLCIIDVGR